MYQIQWCWVDLTMCWYYAAIWKAHQSNMSHISQPSIILQLHFLLPCWETWPLPLQMPLLMCCICPCNWAQMMPVSQSHSSSSSSNSPASPTRLFLTSSASQVPSKWILKECHSFDSLLFSLGLLSGFIMFWVCEPVLFYNSSLFKFYMEHTRTNIKQFMWFV